ncbi:hypothetical protein Patl1_36975 [Pistacia atlantica]|nr:hypothetical protein Patl1_36975 [Pistacia atlantica]
MYIYGFSSDFLCNTYCCHRMIADPTFLYKLLLEQAATIGCTAWWEFKNRKERLSVTIPAVSINALGYGAFLGLYANLRYQLLCGFDRAVINHFDVIGVTLFLSTALRCRADPLVQSDELLKAACNRPSEDAARSSSKWFILNIQECHHFWGRSPRHQTRKC